VSRYLPNILTILRIILTPLFIYFLFWSNSHGHALALVIFGLAGITDIYDGLLARRLKVESTLGKILDPIADKVLVLSAFISFVTLDLIYAWMVALVIFRDVAITAIRFLLEYKDKPMTTSIRAKWKTGIQIGVVVFILLYLSLKSYHVTWATDLVEQFHVILIAMFITVLVTIYTGFDYFWVNRVSLRSLTKSNPH